MFKDSSLSVANFPRFSANKIVGRDRPNRFEIRKPRPGNLAAPSHKIPKLSRSRIIIREKYNTALRGVGSNQVRLGLTP